MALTRKFLTALGIESDKIDEIITSHRETVDALKDEIEKQKEELVTYKSDSEKFAETQKELEKAQNDLADLKENKDASKLEEKYNTLKKEYEDYKSGIEAKMVKEAKEKAYSSLLKEAKIPEKRFASIIKLSEDSINKIEFDDDGNISNKDDISEAIKNDWSEYAQTIEEQGANTPKPPANNGGDGKKISRARQIAQQYHDDLYGKIKED